MNMSPWRLEEVDVSPWRLEEVNGGGVPVEGWLNSGRWSSMRWRLDEQETVEGWPWRGG